MKIRIASVRLRLAVIALFLLVAAIAGATSASSATAEQYIVVLKKGADAPAVARDHARRFGLTTGFVYTAALNGYSATIPTDKVDAVRANKDVAYVELDGVVSVVPPPAPAPSSAAPQKTLGVFDEKTCFDAQVKNPDTQQLVRCLSGLRRTTTVDGVGSSAGGRPSACGDKCPAWVSTFSTTETNGGEWVTDMAISPSGDSVYTTGVICCQNPAIVKYDAATGKQIYVRRPFEGGGFGEAIAVSPDGRRFFAAVAEGGFGRSGSRTFGYDAATGNVLWTARFASGDGNEFAADIGVSPDGTRVYVTGLSGPDSNKDYVTVAYDAASGAELWVSRYNGPNNGHDEPFSLAVAADGTIYVTGYSQGAGPGVGGILPDFDAATVAYTPEGSEIWATRYDAYGGFDRGREVVVAGARVYVTGSVEKATGYPNFEWATHAYAAATGAPLWRQREQGAEGTNVPRGIAASPSGDRVYVTGYVGVGSILHTRTVSYDGASGLKGWERTWASSPELASNGFDVAVSPDGARVFVSGATENEAKAPGGWDTLTLAYGADGDQQWAARYNTNSRSATDTYLGEFVKVSPNGRRVFVSGYIWSVGTEWLTLAYDASGQTVPWGIDRIDADTSSVRAGDEVGALSNVNVYVIDTGVDASHPDLNVVNHVNFAGGQNTDCHGHGTHVAGTIAARDDTRDVVGVAPGAPVTGVKVLGCRGTGQNSAILAGIDWVTKNAVKPAIANMSLGGGATQAIDDAVKRSADSGVLFAVAAGNDTVDACTKSPARAGTHNGVITVAATDSSDVEASFSNYGSCVDIWAPGVGIVSTKRGGGTTTMSGTSMASPHVGGVGALYLSTNTASTAAAVEAALKADAVSTGTSSKDGVAIKLVYAGGR